MRDVWKMYELAEEPRNWGLLVSKVSDPQRYPIVQRAGFQTPFRSSLPKVPGSQEPWVMRTSFSPVPYTQHRLRRQLISGRTETVLTACGIPCTSPQSSVSSTLRSWLSKLVAWATPGPTQLDFIYPDDLGATAVAYLAAGSRIVDAKRMRPPTDSRLATLLSAAWFGTGPLSSHTARARTLEQLLAAGLRPDLSCITDNANTLLHCCLLNGGSPAVLALLLERLPADYPPDLKPRLQVEDAEGHTALELAIHLGQWEAVGLLLRAGALQGSARMSQALGSVRSSIPASSPPLEPLPSLTPSTVLPSSLTALGQRALSMLPFKSMLRLRSSTAKEQQQQQQTSGSAQPVPSAAEMSNRLRALLTACSQEQQAGEVSSSSPAGVKVLAPADVSKTLEEAVALIQDTLNVEEEVALSLLVDGGFDVDAATQLGRTVVSAPEASCAAARGGAGQGAGGATTSTCMICFEEQANEASVVRLPCSHPEVACSDCWRRFIMERVDEGRPFTMACPWPGCEQLLSLKQLQSLVTAEQLARIKAQRASHFVAVHALTTWCPRAGCEAAVKVHAQPAAGTGASDGGEGQDPDPEQLRAALEAGRGVGVACSCGWRFCFQCKASPPHEPASCAQHAAWKQVQAQLQQDLSACSEDWMRENTKPCPRCGVRIQKAGGCLHMHCRNCQHHFCWLCMQPFLPGTGRHQDPFACLGYTQQQAAPVGEASGSLYEALGALWGRMTAHALRKRQEHHMRRYLAFSDSGARAAACLARMRLLLGAATLGARLPDGSSAGLGPSLPAHGGPASLSLPLGSWWQRWQDALTSGREVLANSYVLSYFISDPVALRTLGYLQAQLGVLLEALAAPLAALPGAAGLATAPRAGTGQEEQAGLWQALRTLTQLWTGPGGGSGGDGGSGSGGSGAQLASLDGVHGPEAVEQLFFSMALVQERRATIEALVRDTNRFSLALVRAARSGLFASSSDRKTLGTLDVILGSMT